MDWASPKSLESQAEGSHQLVLSNKFQKTPVNTGVFYCNFQIQSRKGGYTIQGIELCVYFEPFSYYFGES